MIIVYNCCIQNTICLYQNFFAIDCDFLCIYKNYKYFILQGFHITITLNFECIFYSNKFPFCLLLVLNTKILQKYNQSNLYCMGCNRQKNLKFNQNFNFIYHI